MVRFQYPRFAFFAPVLAALTDAVLAGSSGLKGGSASRLTQHHNWRRDPLVEARIKEAVDSIAITNIGNVRGHIFLPTSSAGFPIVWDSSSPSVISSDGRVQRQETDVYVTLTAMVESDGIRRERQFEAQVRRSLAAAPYEGYAFFYFTGSSRQGENIYLAASRGNNALEWRELNGGKPILTSSKGSKGLRDPFIIRSPEGDTFYLLATDLSIGGGTSWSNAVRTGSRYLEIWESHDLKTWSEQRHILVSRSTAGNTWAPEAYYDDELGAYVVFWASSLYPENDASHRSSTYHRMLYATTRDFVTFSEPKIWQDAKMSRIDSTIIKAGGVYYRFSKDEGAGGTGCSDIIQERSTALRASLDGWSVVDSCIGKHASTKAVEGPTSFNSNPGDVHGDKYYLFLDEYGGRGYIPLETADIAKPQWKVSKGYTLPKSPRHGTVIPVTATELASLTGTEAVKKRAALVSPVLPGLYADPNIAIFNKMYYIYATTDGFAGWGGNVFYVWKSANLVDWACSPQPILTLNGTSGTVPWATGNAWAPTIMERGSKYYFYFSVHNAARKTKTIGAATAAAPEGPFAAQPTTMILNNEAVTTNQAIDRAAFYDPATGKYYLFRGNGVPLLAELDESMVALAPNTTRRITGLKDFREGLFPFYRKGVYHLTYSIDDTRSANYRVGYATASGVAGPWTYRGVVLEKEPALGILGTGHNSVINVPGTDDWYMAYHRFAIKTAAAAAAGDGTHRETTIDRIGFDAETGLMQKVVPTLTSVAPETAP